MQTEEALRHAAERAAAVQIAPERIEADLERLRADAAHLFGRIPEPPVYRRQGDPVREQARALLPEAQEVLARCMAFERSGLARHVCEPLALTARRYLEALCHIAAGRLGPAEEAWSTARQLERNAMGARRVFSRSDEKRPPVFDRKTGVSRYDPQPEQSVQVKLACPGCQHVDDFAFSPRHATHQFVCPKCKATFIAYFGEVRLAQVERVEGGSTRRYLFKLQELGGGLSRVEFEDASGAELPVSEHDLLAFLYTDDRELKGVLNLSSSRLMWIRRGGSCFIATAVFGEEAPELAAFRAFRDDVLRRSAAGAWLVRQYYRHGPWAARVTATRPWARRGMRWVLSRVHRRLRAGS